MKCLFRRRKAPKETARPVAADAEIARLTEHADLIMGQLDVVVRRMTEMLRNSPGEKS